MSNNEPGQAGGAYAAAAPAPQKRGVVGDHAIHVEWVLVSAFCALTGYTDRAVRRKIQDGVWLQGRHYRKAPDGHITMNLQSYYKWVEGGGDGQAAGPAR